MGFMIFVLDNYDSFTYNLVQYLGELGAKVEVRRNNEVSVKDLEAMRPERIVISPGPCTPHEAGISLELIQPFCRRCSDSWRVPGTSGDWGSLRWPYRARVSYHARQN